MKIDSTRALVALFLFFLLYLTVLPTVWPEPSAAVSHPGSVSLGSDLPLTVRVTSWHSNYSVRRMRFAINNVNSPAFGDSRPFLPISLLAADPVREWSVPLSDRLTFPRRETFSFTVPLGGLARTGKLGHGLLRGTVDVEVDYAGLSARGAADPRTAALQVPWEVTVTK